MDLNTVNIVEYFDDTIQTLFSFEDNEVGNKEAENLFTQLAKENGFSDDDIEFGLEEGRLDHPEGDYQLYITHNHRREDQS